MATHRRRWRRALREQVFSLVRVVLISVFTGVEAAALVVWLELVRGAPAASRIAAIGLGILFVGLLLEHFLTDVTVNGRNASIPGPAVVGISASEALLWALWLGVAERVGGLVGFLAAAAVLAVLLVPQHTIEGNVLRGDGAFSSLVDLGTVGFSVVESVGATVWLLFVLRSDLTEPFLSTVGIVVTGPITVGVAVLAVALFVEHTIGVAFSRRP